MNQTPGDKFQNHLAGSASPYLLQHAGNPVDWFPWGGEALEKARRENKLIIISIGYAACHWCHVMEHESFSDAAAADLMNTHFVCIKVDREERPDIDQVYMDAVMLMTRRGGWPLNCITLPDGKPIYGGTYFPKAQWMDLLTQLAAFWKRDPDKAIEYGEELVNALQDVEGTKISGEINFSQQELEQLIHSWMMRMDRMEGGEMKEPKFPMPSNWMFLLRASHYTGHPQLKDQVDLTLSKMAWGGINDHVGGGFARYSTDSLWHIPHFEKMLYDNAQLISLYSEAFLWNRAPEYARVVKETIGFLNRELKSPGGAYYSSLDADSEGEEGKFYVWEKSEIDSILGTDSGWFCEYFSISESGNWEHGKNVLITAETPENFSQRKNLDSGFFLSQLASAKEKLLSERARRIRPALDDKIIASWNGLMISGLCDAAFALKDEKYIEEAVAVWSFLEKNLVDGNKITRCWRDGTKNVNGFLDDYAIVSAGLISLFSATGKIEYLEQAKNFCDYALHHFADPSSPLLYYTSDEDAALISRKKETSDNVIPSSNAVMAHNLFRLGIYFEEADFSARAFSMLSVVIAGISQYPSAYSHWADLLLMKMYPPFEVVVTGPDAPGESRKLNERYIPGKIILPLTEPMDLPLARQRFSGLETKFFVCRDKVCKLPVLNAPDAIRQMLNAD